MEPEINPINNQDSNPILDIVNQLKAKLSQTNETVDINTTNNNINNNVNNKDLSGLDISKLLETLKPKEKNNINSPSLNNNPSINLDLNSIMSAMNLLGAQNQIDPRQNLLNSLKPFLRETRQKNIDTYITLLTVMKAFNIFNKDRD